MRAPVWVALLLGASVALTEPTTPAAIEAAADAVASEVRASSPGGLTIAVARAGKTVFAKGYGEADLGRHTPASGDIVYPICSISKNFAAAAVLKLVEQGKVD